MGTNVVIDGIITNFIPVVYRCIQADYGGSLYKTNIMGTLIITEVEQKLYNEYYNYRSQSLSNTTIADILNISLSRLGSIISHYEFESNLEYYISKDTFNFKFESDFNLSRGVINNLSKQEISEIFKFTKRLVKQHGGIDQVQKFYSIDSDCEVLFVDQPLANYPLPGRMTLMLVDEF